MKATSYALLFVLGVSQAVGNGPVIIDANPNDPHLFADAPRIQSWFTPNALSGMSIMVFIGIIFYLAISALDAIQVPSYQLPATDEKNPENNKNWIDMFGNIEKS